MLGSAGPMCAVYVIFRKCAVNGLINLLYLPMSFHQRNINEEMIFLIRVAKDTAEVLVTATEADHLLNHQQAADPATEVEMVVTAVHHRVVDTPHRHTKDMKTTKHHLITHKLRYVLHYCAAAALFS